MPDEAMIYGDGSNSSVGSQIRTNYFYKTALVEAAKEAYFGQLAEVTSMPKNMGKTIKRYHYLPILDDRNINDQGIDADGVYNSADVADGVNQTNGTTAKFVLKAIPDLTENAYAQTLYFEGYASYDSGDTALDSWAEVLAAAQADAEAKMVSYFEELGYSTTSDTTAEFVDAGYDGPGITGTAATGGPADAGWTFLTADAGTHPDFGNLYGSSKDIGTIQGKIPVLSETGGRVNRVGMKRIELEGSLEKFGFFDEYSQESLDFDTDAELEMHITSESVKAANEITEDQLQIDLLTHAGVIRYCGDATSRATLAGGNATARDAGTTDVVTYDDFLKLGIELDNNRTPKNTTIIKGSRMVDTQVVNAARYIYCGSELIPSLMRVVDYNDAPAFIPVAKYAAAGNIARGEYGAIGDFRIIIVPEMMKWEGAGAAVGDVNDDIFHQTGGNYDVFPLLVVGDGSFTTIGFQTDGKTVKFKITHKKPGKEIANRDDPYGEIGFYSIKWYYGFMVWRPERIALMYTIAEV